MAHERATGHYMEKKIGGGNSRSSFGGSMFIVNAKLRNTHMNHKGNDTEDEIGQECDTRMRFYIRRRNSLREELQKLEKEKRQVTHFDKDPRDIRQQLLEGTAKIRSYGRTTGLRRQASSMYTPSFFEETGLKGSSSMDGLNLTRGSTGFFKVNKIKSEQSISPRGKEGGVLHNPKGKPSQRFVAKAETNNMGLHNHLKAGLSSSFDSKQTPSKKAAKLQSERRRSESLSQVEEYLKITKTGTSKKLYEEKV